MVVSRRSVLRAGVSVAAAGAWWSPAGAAPRPGSTRKLLFPISLAQWSLHRAFFSGKRDPLEFASIARGVFGIDAVEYVNQFYDGPARTAQAVETMRRRADEAGVTSLLVMCDGEGRVGEPDETKRKQVVANHGTWLDMAAGLGCHSIRVNAASAGPRDEQAKLAADGLRRLVESAEPFGLNVLVENHGGLSSDGTWLAGVIKRVGHPRCGTLPDFGNFRIDGDRSYDRYRGVTELMPFAKAVSAKSHDFNEAGEEIHTDFERMLRIVLDAGYRGHVGIEYEGESLGEPEGIRATYKLLTRLRRRLMPDYDTD